MELLPSDEQSKLVNVVRNVLGAEMPPSGLREPLGTGQDLARWRKLANLGWIGMAVPEELGGVGYSLVEEALLFLELGRSAAPGPFLATAVACQLGAVSGEADVIEHLMSGEERAGLAVAQSGASVTRDRISGRFLVADGDGAAFLLVFGAGVAALMHAPPASTSVRGLDEAVPLALVEVDASPLLAADAPGSMRVREHGVVLAAAMMAGLAEATRDISVEYAKVREQFNAPIGSFQAVSRRCADMAVRAWNASSLVMMAALCCAEERPDHAYQAAAAQVIAADAATRNAADNIQNLGAIGFTVDHEAHRYFKRARVLRTLWSDDLANTRALVDAYAGLGGLGSVSDGAGSS